MNRPKVAIIIPVYDPPPKWEVSCGEHIIALKTLNPHLQFHFVIINDGSPGSEFADLDKYLKKMKIAHSQRNHSQNYGKGKALRTGVSHIRHWAEYFVCVDWDFPFGSGVVNEIVQRLQKDSDIVTANRGRDYELEIPFIRSLVTRIWKSTVVKHFHLGVTDTQAGVKGFRRLATAAFLTGQINTFLHDLEFLLNGRDQSLRIQSVPVHLRGGVKLSRFSLSVYFRELSMFFWFTFPALEKKLFS